MTHAQSVANVRLIDGRIMVSGRLCFANVTKLYRDSLSLINTQNSLIFDFAQVTSSDSSGLALMIEWIKLARQSNKPIALKYVSGELMSLARASSLEKMVSFHV